MTLLSCVYFFSFLNQIDPQVTLAITQVESSGKVFAVGSSHGEIGLMQIRPQFSKFSRKQLFQSCTNIMVGTQILGRLKNECKLCVDKVWQNRYNLGLRGERKLKHPLKWKYSRKIAAVMERQ